MARPASHGQGQPPPAAQNANGAAPMPVRRRSSVTPRSADVPDVIPALAVVGEVEAGLLVLVRGAEADGRLEGVAEDDRRDGGEDDREADRLELLHPERLADDVLEVQVE